MSAGRHWRTSLTLLAVLFMSTPAAGHDGPPFPIVSDRIAGNYRVSIWTDPDATDDGSAGGRFWIILEGAGRAPVPAGTRVSIAVAPVDRAGPTVMVEGAPTQDAAGRQFGAVAMDHEGRFRVHVTIGGPLGRAAVDAEVDATYDLRPPPIMLVMYALPFLMVGFLWLKLLLRRRQAAGLRTR